LLPSRKSQVVVLTIAALLATLLVYVIVSHGAVPRGHLEADLLQASILALAAISCFLAARRSSGSAREIWFLASAASLLLTAAQCLDLYYVHFLKARTDAPWPSDILYFIWVAPLAMAMLPRSRDRASEGGWLRALDYSQIVVISLTVFLYFFYVPSLWLGRGLEVYGHMLRVELIRDVLVAVALGIHAGRVRGQGAKRLFGSLTAFMGLEACADLIVLKAPNLNVDVTNWVAFAWIVPFLVLTGLAVAWQDSEPADEAESQTIQKMNVAVLSQALPLLVPALVLLMARQIAQEQLTIAWAAIATSFALSGMRFILTNQQLQRAAQEHAKSLLLLEAVSEGTPDAIYVKDTAGRYLMINKAGAQNLGRKVNDVLGKHDVELLAPEIAQKISQIDRDVMQQGKVNVTEEAGVFAGVARSFLSTKGPYRDRDGKVIGLIGISRDITERQKIEKQLQQSQRLESVGTLAGGIAHDFNNLLTVIRGYSSMLSDHAAASPDLVNPVRQIDDAASRAASLTHQLLAFSRRQVLQPRVLNLNDIVKDVETLLRRLIGEDIDLLTMLEPELGSVRADQSQMEQVLMNLAVNSRDAMAEGGKLTIETANVTLDADYAKEHGIPIVGSCIMLALSDTGHGMDPEIITHIFEPFFTTKSKGKGTGLGLSTVYGIVKQSGGYIWVYSEQKRGTSFKIYLPRVDEMPAVIAKTSAATRANGSETILLVEDDEPLRELAVAILTQSGYAVLAAKNPEEALHLSSDPATAFDMLLTDVVMPGMNGRELSKRIAEQRPRIPTLFMSGYTTNAIVHQGVLDSDVAFLQKPFTADVLRARVRQVLDAVRPA